MTGFRATERLVARGANRSWPVSNHLPYIFVGEVSFSVITSTYEGWNFNSGNYLFTTDTK